MIIIADLSPPGPTLRRRMRRRARIKLFKIV